MAIKNADIKIPIPNDFFDFSIDKENKDLLLNQIKNLKLTTDDGSNFDFNIPQPSYLNILSPNELYDCYKILYDNITYVTYKDFLDTLLDCFADFTEYLLKLVKKLKDHNLKNKRNDKIKIYIKKNYAGTTKACKSISAHALIFYLFKLQYKRFPSSKFVQIVDLDEKMEKYKGNLDFNIFLFIDDGIYSGNQITGAIEDLKKNTKLTLNISVISPYISEKFHKIIQKNNKLAPKKQVKFFFKTMMKNFNYFFEKNNTKHQTFITDILLQYSQYSTPLYYFEFKMPDSVSFLPHLLNNKLLEIISTYYKNKALYLDEKSLNTITILKPCINYTELQHDIHDNSCPFPYYKPVYYNYKKYIKIKEFIETYMLSKLDDILKESIKKNVEEITIKFSQILTHEETDKLSKELEELYKLNKEKHILNEAQINKSKVHTFINKYCMEIPENYPQDYITYITLNLSYIVNENNRGKLNDYLKSQNMQDISKQMIDIVNNMQYIDKYYKTRKATDDAADKVADQVVDKAKDKAAEAADKKDFKKKYMKYKYKYTYLKKKLKN